jgi:hypothetical protein
MSKNETKHETKLMESVIGLAEELHFGRAARRLGISQPMLTKNIQDVEVLVGGPLFLRDRKHVALSDAGRAYVQQARISLLYGERAVQSARVVLQDMDSIFHVGRTPCADPFLVSTLLSIQLPLFRRLKIDLASKYPIDILQDLISGLVDLAIAHEPPESPLLTCVQVAEQPPSRYRQRVEFMLGYKYPVECKHPQSERQIFPNIDAAIQKLEERQGPGAVCIGLEDALPLKPSQLYLEVAELQEAAHEITQRFTPSFEQNRKRITQRLDDNCCSVGLLTYSVLAYIHNEEAVSLVTCHLAFASTGEWIHSHVVAQCINHLKFNSASRRG